MTLYSTTKSIVVSVLLLVSQICFAGDRKPFHDALYEVVSAHMWIENEDEKRYLFYDIVVKYRYTDLIRRWNNHPPYQEANILFVEYNDSMLNPEMSNIDMITYYYFWHFSGAYNSNKAFHWKQEVNGEEIYYIEIVERGKEEWGIPLVDGEYGVLVSGYHSDLIKMEIQGDTVTTQIIKRKKVPKSNSGGIDFWQYNRNEVVP
jgi:hypothetical protein